MPTYQYRCPSCGHEFEQFQSITDNPVESCPKCGSTPQRLISGGAGLLFKGSGFYITDYRSESYKAAAKKEESPGKSNSDTAGKSDKTGKDAGKKSASGSE